MIANSLDSLGADWLTYGNDAVLSTNDQQIILEDINNISTSLSSLIKVLTRYTPYAGSNGGFGYNMVQIYHCGSQSVSSRDWAKMGYESVRNLLWWTENI